MKYPTSTEIFRSAGWPRSPDHVPRSSRFLDFRVLRRDPSAGLSAISSVVFPAALWDEEDAILCENGGAHELEEKILGRKMIRVTHKTESKSPWNGRNNEEGK